jgi:hypothetical protein
LHTWLPWVPTRLKSNVEHLTSGKNFCFFIAFQDTRPTFSSLTDCANIKFSIHSKFGKEMFIICRVISFPFLVKYTSKNALL